METRLPAPEGSWKDPKRRLSQSRYLCLFLFALFNPAVRTLRGVSAASRLERMQDRLKMPPVSPASFSEAQHLCDPQLLERVFKDLAKRIPAPTLKDPRHQWEQWLAQDSSVFSALPRMTWAVYGGGRPSENRPRSRAVRLHLSFNVIGDHPASAKVKPANVCERKVWKEDWEPGAAYVGDRYYGKSYGLFNLLDRAGCRYVIRIDDKALIKVQTELPLTPEDKKAGVIRQALVHLGGSRNRQTARVIWIDTPMSGTLILATNLDAGESPAELVSQIYRRRWQVEAFFRWVKCLLGCGHWLAESPEGVQIQLYLALIGALLLHLHLGRRPNKRTFELLQLHFLGLVEPDELARGLSAELAREAKKKTARS